MFYRMGLYHKEMKGFLPLKSMFTFLFFSKSAVTVILPSNPMCGLHCCDDLLEGRRLTVVSGYCINTNKLELSHYSAFKDKLAGAQSLGHTAGIQKICLLPCLLSVRDVFSCA